MTSEVMNPPNSAEQSGSIGPWDVTDPHGFAARYSAAYSRLAVVAAGVAGDPSVAEDIVQDAAIIAFQKAGEFRPGSNFTAWLVEIVRRCALNHRRKTKGRRTYAADPLVLARLDDRRTHSGSGAELQAIATPNGQLMPDQSAFDDQLVQALNELSEDARCCLLLRTVEKLSYAEISAMMEIPEGTAMSHVHRSRAMMRRRLSAGQSSRSETS